MIGILTTAYKRKSIDMAFCLMIERLRQYKPGLFYPVCLYSIPGDNEVYERFSIDCHFYKNDPLGEKFNFGMNLFRGLVSHVLYIDSDDIIDNTYLDHLLEGSQADISRCMGVYFLAVEGSQFKSKARFLNNTYRDYGATGMLFNANFLERTDWKIYEGWENEKMGYNSYQFMLPFIKTQSIFRLDKTGSVLLDIKSGVNMNGFNQFFNTGIEADPEMIFSKLSDKEVKYLQSLIL
jgi:hypothetical protein